MVLIQTEGPWLFVNPLSNMTEIAAFDYLSEQDIRAHFSGERYRVVGWRTQRTSPQRSAPWAPYTCVEVVKRLLGIHDRWVMTPWSLYRYLAKTEIGKYSLTS